MRRSGSVQPELGYSGGMGESRADSPEVVEQAVAVENDEVVMIEEEESEIKEEQAVSKCSMSFLTEKQLLDHCRLVHPPLKPSIKNFILQKLEFGGTGFKCQECQAMITCVSGSQQLSDHWMSHSSSTTTMRFFNMETSQGIVLW